MASDSSFGKKPLPIILEGFDGPEDVTSGQGDISDTPVAVSNGMYVAEECEPCSFEDLPVPDAPMSLVKVDSYGIAIDGYEESSGFLLTEIDSGRCVYFEGDDEVAKTGYLSGVFRVKNPQIGDPEFILETESGSLYRLIHIQNLDYDVLAATGEVRRSLTATLN